MKFFQILTFYDAFLSALYQRDPELANRDYATQLDAILAGGFAVSHMFARYMPAVGYDSELAIANCAEAQFRWAAEHGFTGVDPRDWVRAIAKRQIETIQPDVLFLSDPLVFDSKFLRTLNWRPRLIMGWRAAVIPEGTDWTEFDLMLSHIEGCRRRALELGVKSVEHFFPGMPKDIAETVAEEPKQYDVVFTGQWSHDHVRRNDLICRVARAALEGNFSLGLFLSAPNPESLPPEIRQLNQGPRWGLDMHRALKSGRIVLNAEIDLARGQAGNMRLFETTGTGSFLLTEHHDNIQTYFEPDSELATFRSFEELLDKVAYYLEHEDEREAIAARGKARCLKDYSMENKARELDGIIRHALTHQSERSQLVPLASLDFESLLATGLEHLNASRNDSALECFEQAHMLRPEAVEVGYGTAIALQRQGRTSDAVRSLQVLLQAQPAHQKARLLLSELQVPHGQSPLPSATEQDVRALMDQATQHLKLGQAVKAMRLAERAASLGPVVPEMHWLRCLCLIEVGRHEEALEAAKEELATNPSHPLAQGEVSRLTAALIKPAYVPIPTERRSYSSALSREALHSIQNACHNYQYKGTNMIKNPFDQALYPLLLWNLKPRTIIEIGSKFGGSALWMGDMLNNFGLDTHIYSVDIVRVKNVSHPRVTFMEGDGRALDETFTPAFLASLPRPWLVIEDADHSYETSLHVLRFFDPYLEVGDYIVIEDGIISDLTGDPECNSGPHRALKEFLASHLDRYEVDGEYCDYFGYNFTWNTNGFLKRVQGRPSSLQAAAPAASDLEPDAEELLRLLSPHLSLPHAQAATLYSLAKQACDDNVPGNFVTTGPDAAALSLLLALAVQRYSRRSRWVHALDLFERLPESDLRQLGERLGLGEIVKPLAGPLESSVATRRSWLGMVALLHQGDVPLQGPAIWEQLYDQLSPGGYVALDRFEPETQALNDFADARGLDLVLDCDGGPGAWFQRPDRFPVNPDLDPELIRQFEADDPASTGIVSQMSANERFQLYYLLRTALSAGPLRHVEIGSYQGASLLMTHNALRRSAAPSEGFSVDPWIQPELRAVLEQVSDRNTHLQMLSHEAAGWLKERFEADDLYPEFIFIDGDHSYEGVRQDILDYYPLLKPGGIIVFHDYLPPLDTENREVIFFHHGGKDPGIQRAVDEVMEETFGCQAVKLPLLYPTDPTQTQAHLPIIPHVYSTVRAYRKPL